MKPDRLFLSPPHMSGEEATLVEQAFASNYIAPLGPMVNRFEADFAAYTGIPHCLALNSGTAALHVALRCLGIGPGDLVLASTLTFIGSINPILYLGATPVFIDSAPDSWNMDAGILAQAVDELAKAGSIPAAVIPTDIYGQCNDYGTLMAICETHGIPLLVDAAESVGASFSGSHAGSVATAAAFSFNGNKIITTSGGGMLASHDPDLIARARKISAQAREDTPHYEHREIGYNYRMSNILAAIGIGQLHVLDERVARRRDIFATYRDALGDIPGISFMPEPDSCYSSRWLTVMLIDPDATGASPEDLRLGLEAENIEARPVWKPMHLQPVFSGARTFGGSVSEHLFAHGLCLPSGSTMTSADLDRVISCLRQLLNA